jgi:hypothetical protein
MYKKKKEKKMKKQPSAYMFVLYIDIGRSARANTFDDFSFSVTD